MRKISIAILFSIFTSSVFAQTTEHSLQEAEQYFSQADSLRLEKKKESAFQSAREAREIYRITYGEESAEYGVALGRSAEYLFWCSRSWKPTLLEGLYIVSRKKGTRCDEYARLLTIYARYSTNYNDSLQRMDFARQAVDIRREVLGTEHPDYAWSLTTLGDCFYDGEQYDEAISKLNEAVAILKKNESTHAKQLGNALDLLYKSYRRSGRHEEGMASLAELLDLEKRVWGSRDGSTMKTMRILTDYYKEQGKELEAYRLQEEQNALMEQQDTGQYGLRHTRPLTRLAMSHEARGRYDLAIPIYEQVVDICEKELQGKKASFMDSIWVAQAATNLSLSHQRAGNYFSAIKAANKATGIWDGIGLNKDTTYVELTNRIALCLYKLKAYNKAINFAKQGIDILDANPDMGSLNSTYVDALRILSWSEIEFGLIDEAEQHARRAMDIVRQIGADKYPAKYAHCQCEWAESALFTDYATEALPVYESALNTLKRLVLMEFSSQSALERKITWNGIQHIFYSSYPEFCINYHYSKKHIEDGSALYDYSALFAKGLMLAAETELSEQARRSDDAKLIAHLDTLQALRTQLNYIYDHPDVKPNDNVDPLELSRQIEHREKELVLMMKKTGKDYTSFLQTTWQDVQKALGPEDLAVEFITAHLKDSEIDATIALTLRYDDPYPKMKLLFDSWGLKIIDLGDIYTDPTFYDIVWGNLADRLDGIKNVYFAPSGPLHNMGIENLPGCESRNFYRLSSTRELAFRHQQDNVKTAILYGGIFYDSAPNETIGSQHVRGASEGTPYLEGTAKEVEAIAQLVKKQKYKTTTLTGSSGNEESFKALSGQNIQIAHIATHGFYWQEEKKQNLTEQHNLDDAMPKRDEEDRALSRSGLLMAGADNALDGIVYDDKEDGILTAQEIAQLDLSNFQMIVLSACETALGDISKSEGVFGLQRGFKKAGANSILMSLWKVDDEATCLLMTEFYKYWIGEKMTKHNALEKAKQSVRSHEEKGWNDPKYWAAFILLDGLD